MTTSFRARQIGQQSVDLFHERRILDACVRLRRHHERLGDDVLLELALLEQLLGTLASGTFVKSKSVVSAEPSKVAVEAIPTTRIASQIATVLPR